MHKLNYPETLMVILLIILLFIVSNDINQNDLEKNLTNIIKVNKVLLLF